MSVQQFWEYSPVLDTGKRISPRTEESAMRELRSCPPGGLYSDGVPRPGVVRIDRRFVTIVSSDWEVYVEQPVEGQGDGVREVDG